MGLSQVSFVLTPRYVRKFPPYNKTEFLFFTTLLPKKVVIESDQSIWYGDSVPGKLHSFQRPEELIAEALKVRLCSDGILNSIESWFEFCDEKTLNGTTEYDNPRKSESNHPNLARFPFHWFLQGVEAVYIECKSKNCMENYSLISGSNGKVR